MREKKCLWHVIKKLLTSWLLTVLVTQHYVLSSLTSPEVKRVIQIINITSYKKKKNATCTSSIFQQLSLSGQLYHQRFIYFYFFLMWQHFKVYMKCDQLFFYIRVRKSIERERKEKKLRELTKCRIANLFM